MKSLKTSRISLFEGFYKFYRFVKIVVDSAQRSVFGFVPRCIHAPSCSAYTVRMMKTHGTMRGGLIGLRRVLSCWGIVQNL